MSDFSVTPFTVARQAPLSMGFSRQKYWSGLPFPSPGDLPRPRDGTFVSCIGRQILYCLRHQGSPSVVLKTAWMEIIGCIFKTWQNLERLWLLPMIADRGSSLKKKMCSWPLNKKRGFHTVKDLCVTYNRSPISAVPHPWIQPTSDHIVL